MFFMQDSINRFDQHPELACYKIYENHQNPRRLMLSYALDQFFPRDGPLGWCYLWGQVFYQKKLTWN